MVSTANAYVFTCGYEIKNLFGADRYTCTANSFYDWKPKLNKVKGSHLPGKNLTSVEALSILQAEVESQRHREFFRKFESFAAE